jgi:hypothetical protein
MPYLPLAPALQNWMMIDQFQVQRRVETISTENGRSTIAITETINPVWGVVTPASPTDLKRLSDYDVQTKHIAITAAFAFSGDGANGVKADWITWNGDLYEVLDVKAYERYGLGFTNAIAGLITAQPNVP